MKNGPAHRGHRSIVSRALLLTLLLCLPRFAFGRETHFHPDLLSALDKLDHAKGAAAYVALRRVWSTWDRADPVQVEEALAGAERDKTLSPPIRVYASVLHALGRVRLGDVKSATARIHALGYVDRWLFVGPFDNEGKTGFDTVYGPEAALGEAIVPGHAYNGKERPVRYRIVPPAFPFGYVDSGSLARPEAKICVYLTTFVSGPRAPRKISLWVGSGGAYKLFWNARQVLSDDAYRGHDYDRSAAWVELAPGPNELTLKLCGDEQSPVASVRLGDAQGNPDATLSVANDFALSQSLTNAKRPPGPAQVTGDALEGPLQTFARLVHRNDVSPATLEDYARYLAETSGDDPALHTARDLAKRAADAEPTVERLLLAGRLAEDRNQGAEWLEKAEAFAAKSGRPNREVLLARAIDRRNSPNWRDAFPYFERVLGIDPDNVTALSGRVELYNMAGLPRTALETLSEAVAQNPDSVNLLNMYASQLRMLGRTTDAAEVEDRYAALRFDDAGYLGNMIDLSVSRRERAAAERWTERLLATHPDGLWALGLAAKAYRALGEPERAVATYRRALDLAPEDSTTLRALAELEGDLGRPAEQLALLREILRIRPQDREVRDYVEHLEPQKPRADEAYAWEANRFLKLRFAPPNGQNRRTLRDLSVSTVFENGLSSQYRQIVFQPLTDAAAAAARQYAFGYEADRQLVQLRGARVYRADGRIEEAIESGEGPADDPSIAMYTSARTFYVQFPRLEPGDVVELRYRVDDVTPRNDFGDYFGEVTYLQGMEPVDNAEYVLITPKNRTFYIDHNVPNLSSESQVSGSQRIYRFFAEHIAPVYPEPSMPPLPEVLGFVHVSTYKSWQELGRWYWGLVKDQFDLDDETRKLAHEITKGASSELDKVKAVYAWVTNNTRYVALEFGIYGYKPRRCVQTVARGWGDCKDKATVIVTLLKELGIRATLVIVRTQLRGELHSSIASFAPFDHAIAYVPSLDLYLDGTAEHTGIYELPRMDIGALGLQVNEGNAKLVTISNPSVANNFVRREVHAQLDKSGDARLDLDYTTSGYNAAEWRSQYHAQSTRRERVNNDLGREFPGFEIAAGQAGIQTSDLENAEEPARVRIHGTARGFARHEGKQLSMPVTGSFRLTQNFASLSQRHHDLRLLALARQEDVFTIKLPPGTKVVSAPQSASGDGPFGSFAVEVQTDHDQISVTSRIAIKVSRITPKDYPSWKRFCEEVDRALNPRLVIE